MTAPGIFGVLKPWGVASPYFCEPAKSALTK